MGVVSNGRTSRGARDVSAAAFNAFVPDGSVRELHADAAQQRAIAIMNQR
jgi:hypothetical protein